MLGSKVIKALAAPRGLVRVRGLTSFFVTGDVTRPMGERDGNGSALNVGATALVHPTWAAEWVRIGYAEEVREGDLVTA